MSIASRFQGEDGKRRLIEELCSQAVVRGDKQIATAIVDAGSLLSLKTDDELIVQGASDSDIFFIISGEFDVLVNKRLVANRSAGHHVGEMSMIDSSSSRSGTLKAKSDAVVVGLSEEAFTRLADEKPVLWRLIAKGLSSRLRERSKFIKEPNLHPHIFLGSSSEYLKVVEKLQQEIASDNLIVRLWTEGIFQLSSSSLHSLYSQSQQVDFAVLLLGPDDKLESRDEFYLSPRDNLVFELGLFMGAICPERTIFIASTDSSFKIPSDLKGITYIPASFDQNSKSVSEDEIKLIASKIIAHIGKFGVR